MCWGMVSYGGWFWLQIASQTYPLSPSMSQQSPRTGPGSRRSTRADSRSERSREGEREEAQKELRWFLPAIVKN